METVEPYVPEPQPHRRRGVAVAGALVAVIAVGAVLAGGGDGGGAEEALHRMRSLAAADRTVRITGSMDGQFDVDGEEGNRMRMTIEGELAAPASGRVTVRFESSEDEEVAEAIFLPSASYLRTVGPQGPTAWVKEDPTESEGPDLFDVEGLDVDSLLADLDDVERVDKNTFRGTAQGRTSRGSGASTAVAEVTIDHDGEGRLERYRLAVDDVQDGTKFRMAFDLRFHDWGADITIEAPPTSEIDPTPLIDEEAIADFDGEVLAPTDLPAGWTLRSAQFEELEKDADSFECAEVVLTFGTDDEDAPSARVILSERRCSTQYGDDDETDDVVERFGPYEATVLATARFYYREDGMAAAVEREDGRILVSTDAGRDVLAQLVASLAPWPEG